MTLHLQTTSCPLSPTTTTTATTATSSFYGTLCSGMADVSHPSELPTLCKLGFWLGGAGTFVSSDETYTGRVLNSGVGAVFGMGMGLAAHVATPEKLKPVATIVGTGVVGWMVYKNLKEKHRLLCLYRASKNNDSAK